MRSKEAIYTSSFSAVSGFFCAFQNRSIPSFLASIILLKVRLPRGDPVLDSRILLYHG